jgi:beta-lactamase class D
MQHWFIIPAALLAFSAQAADTALDALFARHHANGTLIISTLDGSQHWRHNDARAGLRLPVASTFKILNTLIGLESGAISGQGSEFKWDGKQHNIADWNRDQTLDSAFRVSCVWCYQQLASRVGADTYRQYLQQAGYGSLREPFELTRFWLDGSLQVSAEEQIALLRKLYRRSLPFSTRSYDTLQEVMLAEQREGYRLYAKTGWASSHQPAIGWYVGYVEKGKAVWLFASNIDIDNASQLPLRQALTHEALRLKGVLPPAAQHTH